MKKSLRRLEKTARRKARREELLTLQAQFVLETGRSLDAHQLGWSAAKLRQEINWIQMGWADYD